MDVAACGSKLVSEGGYGPAGPGVFGLRSGHAGCSGSLRGSWCGRGREDGFGKGFTVFADSLGVDV